MPSRRSAKEERGQIVERLREFLRFNYGTTKELARNAGCKKWGAVFVAKSEFRAENPELITSFLDSMPVDSGSGISPTPETVGNHLYLPLNIESMERKKVGGRQMITPEQPCRWMRLQSDHIATPTAKRRFLMNQKNTLLAALLSLIMSTTLTAANPNPSDLVVATIPVGGLPLSAVVSPDSSTLYVANFNSYTISVINTATNTVTMTLALNDNPDAVALSADGASLYVTSELGGLFVFNTSTWAVITGLGVGNPNGNNTITISPDGSFAYAGFYEGMSVINTVTNKITYSVYNLPEDESPYGFLFTPNGKYAYSLSGSGLLRVTTKTLQITQIAGSPYGISMSISPNGQTLYIGRYVTTSGGNTAEIVVYDIANNTIDDTIILPVMPNIYPSDLQSAITPDGKYLYFPHSNVFVVRTRDNKVIDSIQVGNGLYAMAVAPNGQFMYALNGADGTVSVIDIQPQGAK